jgi:hypothetical protein
MEVDLKYKRYDHNVTVIKEARYVVKNLHILVGKLLQFPRERIQQQRLLVIEPSSGTLLEPEDRGGG